jgi:hypothetical protein
MILYRSRLLALTAILAVTALAARADTFNFSAVGSAGGFSGSGVLTASQVGSSFLITDITGTGVTGLIAPGGFNGNDNLLFPSATPTLDSHGFSFSDVNGPDTFDVNIFNNGSGYFVFLEDEDRFTETIPVNFSLSAATPEPSSFTLLGIGILGLVETARRKVFNS